MAPDWKSGEGLPSSSAGSNPVAPANFMKFIIYLKKLFQKKKQNEIVIRFKLPDGKLIDITCIEI